MASVGTGTPAAAHGLARMPALSAEPTPNGQVVAQATSETGPVVFGHVRQSGGVPSASATVTLIDPGGRQPVQGNLPDLPNM
jgi:hypothetical protein